MLSDAERWDERYEDHDVATAAVMPEALATDERLADAVARHGRAIDIACGAGAQSLWLAERGLDVIALDVSGAAIDLTTEAARRSGTSHRIAARRCDLDGGLPDDLFDGGADVVVCQRFRDVALYPAIVDVLRTGGVGIVTVLSAVGLGSDPGPFHAEPGELVAAFTSDRTELLAHTESDGVASVVFRRV